MKSLDEVGAKSAIKFALYSLVQVIYHRLINHLLYFPVFRKYFLEILGAKIGNNTQIMDISFFNWHRLGPKGLKIGMNCFLSDEVLIDLYESVIVEDDITIGQRVTVLTHTNVGYSDHPLQKYFPKTSAPVRIKAGSFIGAGAIIMSGITIGKESFVAAGSVVTKNVPPRTLVAGVPAKIIRKLS